MAQVDTVLGPIDSSSMGMTLMHEHVFAFNAEIQLNYPERWDEEVQVGNAIRQLADLKARGVDTIVDLTVLGLGRFIPRIKTVSAASGVNIIVATGLYSFNEVPHYFNLGWDPGDSASDPMIGLFASDISDGIGSTGVRAAILKCATDAPGITEGVDRVLRAVAKTHRRTGAPISTHTDGRHGDDQQRVFREEGVDLSRVIIGHCGDRTDLDYVERIIEGGSYVGMDRFGVDTVPFETRVGTVAALCERGYAQRVVLSHDYATYTDSFDPKEFGGLPNWNYNHIVDDVLPALSRAGVSDADIHLMMVANPRRIFEETMAY